MSQCGAGIILIGVRTYIIQSTLLSIVVDHVQARLAGVLNSEQTKYMYSKG